MPLSPSDPPYLIRKRTGYGITVVLARLSEIVAEDLADDSRAREQYRGLATWVDDTRQAAALLLGDNNCHQAIGALNQLAVQLRDTPADRVTWPWLQSVASTFSIAYFERLRQLSVELYPPRQRDDCPDPDGLDPEDYHPEVLDYYFGGGTALNEELVRPPAPDSQQLPGTGAQGAEQTPPVVSGTEPHANNQSDADVGAQEVQGQESNEGNPTDETISNRLCLIVDERHGEVRRQGFDDPAQCANFGVGSQEWKLFLLALKSGKDGIDKKVVEREFPGASGTGQTGPFRQLKRRANEKLERIDVSFTKGFPIRLIDSKSERDEPVTHP